MILLTGANGQLGWDIQRLAQDIDMRAVTRAELDITSADDVARVFDETAPAVVINAAAYTAVDKAESEKEAAVAVNRDGARHLAEACARAGAVLIHISTDYVFAGDKPGAYTENDPVAPLGVYGASKLAGEDAVKESGAKAIILRTAWVYGLHGHNFVKTMLRLGAERDQLRVVDDQRGSPTYAGDLAAVTLALAARAGKGEISADGFGTYHCVGGGETTWCGFARAIFAEAGDRLARRPKVDAITTADYPTPAKRPANSVLDCGKLVRVHGLALRPWQDALREMLDATLTKET